MAKRKRNPGVGTALVLAALATGGYFVYKGVVEDKDKKPAKKNGVKKLDPLDQAMPDSADFPVGWLVDDAGFDSSAAGDLTWRVLKLNGPSDKCDPPCTYVLVSVGSRADKMASTSGWSAHTTKERAYEELVRQTDKFTT